jgi:hypothetical protein
MKDGIGELRGRLLRNVNDGVVFGWKLQSSRQLDVHQQTWVRVLVDKVPRFENVVED